MVRRERGPHHRGTRATEGTVFDRLVASAPRTRIRVRFLPSGSFSAALHALVIYAAIVATRQNRPAELVRFTDLIEWQDPDDRVPEPLVTVPPVEGLDLLVPPLLVPTVLPPVNPRQQYDSSWFRRTLPRPFTPAPEAGAPLTGAAFIELAVDEKPERLSTPPLDYPEILKQAGIEGSVVIEAIIDTTGTAEPGSVRVVQSSHRAFEAAARDAVLRSRYRPGRVRGQAVRVRGQVPITFSIRR